MLRSLYTGMSGLQSNQIKIDVISNNISNSSTTGFKAGRVTFKDLFSQTISAAQLAGDDIGGKNAQQVGLGVGIGSIDTIMTDGTIQSTNRDLDFAVSGKGFFVLSRDREGESLVYSRDGSFYTDNEGNLVNANGLYVLGFSSGEPEENMDDVAIEGESDDLSVLQIPVEYDDDRLEGFSVDSTGLITAAYGGKTYYIGRIALADFTNPGGLEKVGANAFKETANTGEEAIIGTGGMNGFGIIRQSALEMSNVDLASEMTEMIIASRAYQANVNSITTSDQILQELVNVNR